MANDSQIGRANSVQWVVWIAILFGFFGALYLGNAVGTGNHKSIYLVFLGLGGMCVALFVGQRYWLFGIACFCLNIPLVSLGIRAFELPEVGAVYLFASYLLMLAFHRNQLNLNRFEYLGFFLFLCLVTLTLAVNPVGLLGFGSEVGGARSYIKIYMAAATLLVLSNQIIADKDLRWVILLMILGATLGAAWALFEYFFLGVSAADEADQIYSWHQILAGPPFTICLWLFARYKPSEIFSLGRPFRLALVIFSILITFESGKRGMVASILLIPVLAAFIHGQVRYAFFLAAAVITLLSIVTMGQGGFFDLPLRAQRALMYLPADWDQEIVRMKSGGSMDTFREEMRRRAWEKAVENPWIGEGFALDLKDTGGMGEDTLRTDPTAILALGRAWHSLWFGLAADFGFLAWPCYLLIYITMFFTFRWIIRNAPADSYMRVVTIMLFISFLVNLLKSFTSGHSANTPFGEWWTFGLLIAIRYSLKDQLKTRDGNPPLETGLSPFKRNAPLHRPGPV